MDPQDIMGLVKKRAKNNFKTGMNCAECVLEAFLHHIFTGLCRGRLCA